MSRSIVIGGWFEFNFFLKGLFSEYEILVMFYRFFIETVHIVHLEVKE